MSRARCIRGTRGTLWNKLLKGSLVRWLLTEQPPGPEALGDFRHPLGYRFDPRASELDGPVASVVLRAAP